MDTPIFEVFDENIIKLLIETRDLLDELLETLDIMSSPETLRDIEEAEKEVKEGKIRDLEAFLEELSDE